MRITEWGCHPPFPARANPLLRRSGSYLRLRGIMEVKCPNCGSEKVHLIMSSYGVTGLRVGIATFSFGCKQCKTGFDIEEKMDHPTFLKRASDARLAHPSI